jgi:hypothetical protein
MLVVDFTWYLPGPFASRELLRLGARVVHVEPPQGDPMRPTAPAWHDAVNAGKAGISPEEQQRYLRTAPELAVYPGLLISLTVVSINFRGDALREDTVDGQSQIAMLLRAAKRQYGAVVASQISGLRVPSL